MIFSCYMYVHAQMCRACHVAPNWTCDSYRAHNGHEILTKWRTGELKFSHRACRCEREDKVLIELGARRSSGGNLAGKINAALE